jgi:hypothetical protein
VIVAPDDGHGGSYNLPHAMYSPEGDKYEGHVSLQPGEGMLLLDAIQPNGNDQHLLDLKLLSDWPNAEVSAEGISLKAGAPLGSHDMLLDAIRSPLPRNTLQLTMQAEGPATQLQVVAEVDDPSHRTEFAVLEIGGGSGSSQGGGTQSIGFRTSDTVQSDLPVVGGPVLTTGAMQTLNLDGHALFAKANLTFRRWDYVRFNGAMKLKSVALVK